MDSDCFKCYSLIKFLINFIVIMLIIFAMFASVLTGGLWIKVLFTSGSFNIVYLLSCIILRLIAGWLIKLIDDNHALIENN